MEQLKENNALEITSAIESMLKQKTVQAIDETRKQVAAETFGMSFDNAPENKIQEDAEIDAAWASKEQLNERSEVDHPLAKELADKALHNHHEFHAGNMDAHHGGWAQHDLHTWAKNYAKKKAKGIYDKELAVKGLTHAVKNSEASYFGKAHGTKHGQHVSGATRTQAARHLLPHVEKMMDQHAPKPKAKKAVAESEDHAQAFRDWKGKKAYWQQSKKMSDHGYYKMKGGGKAPWSDSVKKKYKDTGEFHKAAHAFNEAEKAKPTAAEKAKKVADWKNDVRMPWPKNYVSKGSKSPIHDMGEAAAAAAIPMDGYQIRARQKGAAGQAEFNKKWHSAKSDDEKKALRKHAFHHDLDIPWDDKPASKAKSSIHSFSEHVNNNLTEEVKGIPYPAKSKHLSAYKPKSDSDTEMHLTHPGGHSLTWHKKDNTFTHTSAAGKTKKGKMVDLHPHLSKVHHDFDGKVEQHMKDHLHDGGAGLLHKMGKLSYAHHTHPEGRDHEEDAINHKAMRSAYLKLTKRERGVK
jgi:hypothetical protein